MIEVIHPGLLTTIQDAGRKGFESYGVSPSGFFDPFLAQLANKLAGNELDAPCLEFALIGPSLKFHEDSFVAITGFDPVFSHGSASAPVFSAFQAAAGSELRFRSMKGWYGYLATGGGLRTIPILNSASTYVAGGIGKRLRRGDTLQSGKDAGVHYAWRDGYRELPEDGVLKLLPALHTSLFSARERQKITEHHYRISSQSNRMGIRLDGAPLDPPAVRRSAPVLAGTVQVPQSGPLVLGPEGPTTGGYPQIGTISRASWTALAGLAPGRNIRFAWSDPETVRRMWLYRQELFRREEPWQRL